MSLALARRSLARCTPRCVRAYHQPSHSTGSRPDVLTRIARVGLFSGAVAGATLAYGPLATVYSDAPESGEGVVKSLSSLIRSYLVFSACSIPFLVDSAPSILSALLAVPGVKQVTEAVVRATFFQHFVGGDTAEDCLPILEKYREENKGCLFAYSVEVDEDEASGKASASAKDIQPKHKQGVAEMIHSIDVAADFEERYIVNPTDPSKGRKTWVAIKLTALLPHAQALIKFSSYLIKTRPATPDIPFPGIPYEGDLNVLYAANLPDSSPLTESDIADLRELHEDLVRICTRAQERGVRIIMDAEYSWYQPAVDAFVYALVRQFNKVSLTPKAAPSSSSLNVQPLIYQTYQAYLRRTPRYLAQSIADARRHDYALGVKLVRGAYHPHEIAAHGASAPAEQGLAVSPRALSPRALSLSISPDPVPPVWGAKADTDGAYNMCARMLVGAIRDDIKGRGTGWWWAKDAVGRGGVPRVGVLFGTHNWESARGVLRALVEEGLAVREEEGQEAAVRIPEEVTERVTMGQLYGMCDELTDYLVEKTRCSAPFVIKYIPYGALSEVMPYLSRRAIENKSVLGNGAATVERKRAWAEIRKRLFG